MARSLTSRPADLGYVAFLLFHLLASLLVDGQSFYPAHLVPPSLKQVKADYLRDSKDPLIGNAFSPRYAWFTLALVTEMVIQVPSFLLGAIGLIQDDKRYYPLIIAYASWATLSTAQCLYTLLAGEEASKLSSDNRRVLLSSYIPFAVVPAIMLVDFTLRTTKLIAASEKVGADRKKR